MAEKNKISAVVIYAVLCSLHYATAGWSVPSRPLTPIVTAARDFLLSVTVRCNSVTRMDWNNRYKKERFELRSNTH